MNISKCNPSVNSHGHTSIHDGLYEKLTSNGDLHCKNVQISELESNGSAKISNSTIKSITANGELHMTNCQNINRIDAHGDLYIDNCEINKITHSGNKIRIANSHIRSITEDPSHPPKTQVIEIDSTIIDGNIKFHTSIPGKVIIKGDSKISGKVINGIIKQI